MPIKGFLHAFLTKKNFMKRRIVYLPLIFSLLLAGGIYLGMRLATPEMQQQSVFRIPGHSDTKLAAFRIYRQDYVDVIDRTSRRRSHQGHDRRAGSAQQYITVEEFHEMNDPLLGSFEGIGVSFRIEKDTITVINPVKGGPSEKVGIMAGDRIIYIEDSLAAGVEISNRDAMRQLKGDKGTKVRVRVLRRGVDGLIDFTITRDVIPTYSLDIAYMVAPETGFIRLNKFSATTYEEFSEAVDELLAKGMQRLILDLRGNTGGYLRAATQLADEFLPDGKLIVYTEGKIARAALPLPAAMAGSKKFQ